MEYAGKFKSGSIPDNPPSNPECFVIPSYGLRDYSRPNKPTALSAYNPLL